MEFLQSCKKEKLNPKFLQFKVGNKRLESSEADLTCISYCKTAIQALKNRTTSMKSNLHKKWVLWLMCTFLRNFYCEIIRTSPKFARTRLRNFIIPFWVTLTSHDPDKVIFNFLSHDLYTTEKCLLLKGQSFAIPPENINCTGFMQSFELLHSRPAEIKKIWRGLPIM